MTNVDVWTGLAVINIVVSGIAAILNLRNGILGKRDDVGIRITSIFTGLIASYFCVCYTLAVIGIIPSSEILSHFFRPANLLIFFTMIWSSIAHEVNR